MTDKSFPLSGPINLLVRTGHGSVTVTAVDGLDTATVRLIALDADSDIAERTAVELRGPVLAIVAPNRGGLTDLLGGWRRDRDALDVEITVPSGTATKITTASADVRIIGRTGGADLATGSANIDVDIVDGNLRLRTGSATSRVGEVRGDVQARAGSGTITLGKVAGSVQSGFGSGDLTVETAHGNVRSRAGSGDAVIGCAYGDVEFTAGSGKVSVGLPEGVSARLDVTSGSGRVRSDLPIEDAPRSGRSITVRARTGSGDIQLFRAGQAA
ncbi:MAG TPA: DUF4097 family beta strand repeat-containing protein [Jatrophihabitans sp.]|jgi:hypothetical protein